MPEDDMSELTEYIKANPPKGEFVPSPHYIPEGDMIHYYFSNEASYSEHVDNCLTLFKTFDGDKIVGAAISGVDDCVGISTLRTALSKALGECESEGGPCSCHESYLSLKAAGYRRDDPNCGVLKVD